MFRSKVFDLSYCKIYCLKLKISITPEPIEFSIFEKLHIGQRVALGYSIVTFKSCEGFRLFFQSSNKITIDARNKRFNTILIEFKSELWNIYDLMKIQRILKWTKRGLVFWNKKLSICRFSYKNLILKFYFIDIIFLL